MSPDPGDLLIDGGWQHRFVAANGCRFHLAMAGYGPLVVLLHGFGGLWWTWRRQIPALATAGLGVAALDLRGAGASDRPPRGYDLATLTADVAGVVRALGRHDAVIVGQGYGAAVAWAMPALQPRVTRAIAVLGMGHPLTVRRAALRRDAARSVLPLRARLPGPSGRRLSGDRLESVIRHGWGEGEPAPEMLEVARRMLTLPAAPRRLLAHARTAPAARRSGHRSAQDVRRALRRPVSVPVLQLHGERDPWVAVAAATRSRARVGGPLTARLLPGVGHFLPEEAPTAVTTALLEWLTEPVLRPLDDVAPVRTEDSTRWHCS